MTSALKLLTRRGYRRIRLADVAADAGVSKATIYHYFDNKDDLLTQTVAARMTEKQAAIERRLASAGGTAADRLRLFLSEFWAVSLTLQAGCGSGCSSARSSLRRRTCSRRGRAASSSGGRSSSG